ncbi:MAG: 30S ribosomal protein S17 [Solirubrobacterales bacterium]|nr:30S ribosomal protein S17 [Solirubrobacterales bacterium]
MAEEPEETSADDTASDIPPEAAEDASASEAQSASETDGAAETSGASASDADSSPAQAAEVLPPKERRRRERAAKEAAVPTRAQTSPEERQAEREAERRRKAVVRSGRRRRGREKAKVRRGETPEPLAPRRELHPGQQKTRQGVVVSDKASKTIVVRIDVTRRHRSYGKVVRTSTTLHAHDEREDAHIGDTVVVRESRPLSRTKRWRLIEVLERAK